MEQAISKMKGDYDRKIEDCDKIIKHLRQLICNNRRDGNDSHDGSLRKDRAIEQAKRQAYVQAKYDLDSLLDYI